MRSAVAQAILTSIMCVSIFSFCSCYTVRPADLPGRYTVKPKWGTAELLLLEGGRLEEVVTDSSGRHTTIGTWRLLPGGSVERKPCFVFDYDGLRGKLESCSGKAHRYSDGHFGIGLDPDFEFAYEK